MPHARHGGSGNASVAIVGSKFDGTGFENEQIGHTQVPLTVGGRVLAVVDGRNGLEDLVVGEDEEISRWYCGFC
jgi:hypothetical protein